MSALDFKARVDPFTCMLCCLCARESLDSPTVWHLLTSWQPAEPFWSTYLWTSIESRICRMCHYLTAWEVLPIELCRLGSAQNKIFYCCHRILLVLNLINHSSTSLLVGLLPGYAYSVNQYGLVITGNVVESNEIYSKGRIGKTVKRIFLIGIIILS